MQTSSAERNARRILPIIRFMQTGLPLPLAQRLNRAGTAHPRLNAGSTHAACSADGVPCVWITPANSRRDAVLLYLHGGGFVFGLTSLHLQMVARLAEKMGVRALLVDYRLAPQHPFPAALEDCLAAYRWLLRQGIAAENIVVAGDSAGGNLTLTLLMRLRENNEALPAAAACLSPVTDLVSEKKYRDPLLPPEAMRLYTRSYAAGQDLRNPLISPVFGRWHDLPPLLVHVGEDELLRPDAERAAELAQAAGCEVRLEVYARMWHVWQLFGALPQAQQSLEDIGGFLGARLGKQP